jgi:hypothetical protein
MLSFRKKNYALIGYDSRISINGTTLIPRNIEGFGKKFLSKCIQALLNSDITALHENYIAFHKTILDHRLNINDFQKTETLGLTKDEYIADIESKKRHRSAPFEAAVRSKLEWLVGDKISYYVTGDDPNPRNFEVYKVADDWDSEFPDENVPYYLKRLSEIAKKFEPFFTPKDFHSIFSADDLFGFSSEGKVIINTFTAGVETGRTDEEAESYDINPKIWLDVGGA